MLKLLSRSGFLIIALCIVSPVGTKADVDDIHAENKTSENVTQKQRPIDTKEILTNESMKLEWSSLDQESAKIQEPLWPTLNEPVAVFGRCTGKDGKEIDQNVALILLPEHEKEGTKVNSAFQFLYGIEGDRQDLLNQYNSSLIYASIFTPTGGTPEQKEIKQTSTELDKKVGAFRNTLQWVDKKGGNRTERTSYLRPKTLDDQSVQYLVKQEIKETGKDGKSSVSETFCKFTKEAKSAENLADLSKEDKTKPSEGLPDCQIFTVPGMYSEVRFNSQIAYHGDDKGALDYAVKAQGLGLCGKIKYKTGSRPRQPLIFIDRSWENRKDK